MGHDDMTTKGQDKAANVDPVVRHVSTRLSSSEIESLRQNKKRAIEYAQAHFARAGKKTDPPPPASRLSPSEIERLRQDKKESTAYCQKAFQKK